MKESNVYVFRGIGRVLLLEGPTLVSVSTLEGEGLHILNIYYMGADSRPPCSDT